MMTRALRNAVLLTLVLMADSLPAAEPLPSLLEYELKSLEVPEVHSLTRYEGKPLLMLFFEPSCTWCFRQVRDINALRKQCAGAIAAVAIGVNGNRTILKQELRRLNPQFPAYQASPELLKSLGGVPATPFTILGDAAGRYVNWLRGYVPIDRLRAVIDIAGGPDCSA